MLSGTVTDQMSSGTASVSQHESTVDATWALLRAASALADSLDRNGRFEVFGADDLHGLRPLPGGDGRGAVLAWHPGVGWESRLPADDARSELLSLYLPICSATSARPVTVGHLGQSLDGFIATPSGDSHTVTGSDNIVHMHRLRALCDAVLVGAGTVAADDPLLTTRHVSGANPLRVVFDPRRRLTPTFRIFTDRTAPALYICDRSRTSPGESRMGSAVIAAIEDGEPGDQAAQALRLLHARGCARVLVEGGGVTVSRFLEANLLDRLQIAIAPVLIGEGRPAVRLPPQVRLRDCRRPVYRVFRMGGDVLFDCDLRLRADPTPHVVPGNVNRII
jgi:diaminohydroxyphosphoribosylaminopyrimidine deaminase / 5-amino-6-(5-phosphoribosylamino)uracil reductase